jgi:hypothetical protein
MIMATQKESPLSPFSNPTSQRDAGAAHWKKRKIPMQMQLAFYIFLYRSQKTPRMHPNPLNPFFPVFHLER